MVDAQFRSFVHLQALTNAASTSNIQWDGACAPMVRNHVGVRMGRGLTSVLMSRQPLILVGIFSWFNICVCIAEEIDRWWLRVSSPR